MGIKWITQTAVGAGFTLGPEQNVFTGADRAAAEAARDAYAVDPANAAWLPEYNADTSLNIRLEYANMGNNIAQYQVRNSAGDAWLDNESFDALRGPAGAGADFTGLTPGVVPVVNSAVDGFDPSSISETVTEVEVDKTIRTRSADALNIRPHMLEASGQTLSSRNTATNDALLLIGTLINEAGDTITKAFHYDGSARADFIAQPDGTQTLTATQVGGTGPFRLQFELVIPVNRLNFSGTFQVITAVTGGNLIVRRESHTGPEVYNYVTDIDENGFDKATGSQTLDFEVIQDFRAGVTSYVTIESDTVFALAGNASGIPQLTLNTIQFDIDPYVTESEAAGSFAAQTAKASLEATDLFLIEEADGTKRTITQAQLPPGGSGVTSAHDLTVDIPDRVDLNTDLNVATQVAYAVTNFSNVTAARILVTPGDDQTLTTPTRDGSQTEQVTFTGISTAVAGDITFQVELDLTGGGTVTSNVVTVQVADLQPHEQVHFGFIDIGEAVTDIDFTTDDISTAETTAGDYTVSAIPTDGSLKILYFAVPSSFPQITSIFQGSFDLGTQFAAAVERTIASETYEITLMLDGSAVNSNYNDTVLTVGAS